MYPFPASTGLLLGFVLLPSVLLGLVAAGHIWAARALGIEAPLARRRTAAFVLAALGWQALVTVLALAGAWARFDFRPPPLALMFAGITTAVVWLVRSPVGQTLQAGLPLPALVAFQGFRLPLELMMHDAAVQGVMPVQMTFTGWNFDIVTGASALAVAGLVATGIGGRRLVLAWSALGTALLATIVVIALASTPVFRAFGDGPALNTFVAYAPFTTLPTVMVALAMAGHALIWRRVRSAG